jgi:hypothetical protein
MDQEVGSEECPKLPVVDSEPRSEKHRQDEEDRQDDVEEPPPKKAKVTPKFITEVPLNFHDRRFKVSLHRCKNESTGFIMAHANYGELVVRNATTNEKLPVEVELTCMPWHTDEPSLELRKMNVEKAEQWWNAQQADSKHRNWDRLRLDLFTAIHALYNTRLNNPLRPQRLWFDRSVCIREGRVDKSNQLPRLYENMFLPRVAKAIGKLHKKVSE